MTTCLTCGEDVKLVTVFRGSAHERTLWVHVRPRTQDDEDHEVVPAPLSS